MGSGAAIYESLRQALAREFPKESFQTPRFLRFGSWMGGDRDGHPDVTWDITERTLIWLRDTAIDRHLERCKRLYDFLTVAEIKLPTDHELVRLVARAEEKWPAYAETLSRVAPHEIYRRWIKLIEWRLNQSRCTSMAEQMSDGAYIDGIDLERDVQVIVTGLQARHGHLVEANEIQGWLDLTRVFGLNLTRLDVRQDHDPLSRSHDGITAGERNLSGFRRLEELGTAKRVAEIHRQDDDVQRGEAGALTRETLCLFRMLRGA
ncbi:MAG: phosphoenolpyruvate carboxylase [Planctomycetales bacterium]